MGKNFFSNNLRAKKGERKGIYIYIYIYLGAK